MNKFLKLLIRHKVKAFISWHPKARYIKIRIQWGVLFNDVCIYQDFIKADNLDLSLAAVEDCIRTLKKAGG